MAVYEELAPPESPRRGGLKRKGLKARALSQVVTPGSATYLMGGDVCLRANEDVDYRPARPYAAVAFSPATGYTLVTVSGFASSTSSQKEETKKQRRRVPPSSSIPMTNQQTTESITEPITEPINEPINEPIHQSIQQS